MTQWPASAEAGAASWMRRKGTQGVIGECVDRTRWTWPIVHVVQYDQPSDSGEGFVGMALIE